MFEMSALVLFSQAIGWVYTLLWSLSFYPQIFLNYSRGSVKGFSQDFAHLNVLGFLCYTIYNASFLLSREIQHEYRERHGGRENVVRWNDATFAAHAFTLASIQLGQSYWYSSGNTVTASESEDLTGNGRSNFLPRRPYRRLSGFTTLSLISLLVAIFFSFIFSFLPSHPFSLQPLDFVNFLSYVKLYVTLVKYFPQLTLNWKRKSTRGFSISNILLDFTGGVLSLGQLLLDAGIINKDWSAVTGDFGKL